MYREKIGANGSHDSTLKNIQKRAEERRFANERPEKNHLGIGS